MYADLDKRGLMTISDITPAEARTLLDSLYRTIQDTEEMLFDDWGDAKFRAVYAGELKRLKNMAAHIGIYFPAPDGKRAETVGDVTFG